MRIGLTSLYAWRPHVEHTHFLAELARAGGHEVRFLTCDGDLPSCYTRQLRDRPAWKECLQCRLGGIRSFEPRGVSAISDFVSRRPPEPDGASLDWTRSSASTLGRFESNTDFDSPDFHALNTALAPAARMAHEAALQWIERERLDAVIVFNGRMDITRAVFEAARSMGKRALSHERTWFGDGIQLLPDEHCLGLSSVWRLVSDWRDRPLTQDQALRAAGLVARRFLRRNQTEWRAYNLHATATPWPVTGARVKALFLPSSTNETWSHPQWTSGWPDPTTAMDAVMERLGLTPQDVVMRCHPNWAERIGRQDGHRPERHYSDWARSRGIHVIASHESTSTMHLIEQCDLLLLQSGSAALEAGLLGKPVVSTAPSIYHLGGFTRNVHEPGQLGALSPFDPAEALDAAAARDVARQALRFAYTMVYRVPQFTRQVRAIETTRYAYLADADPARLTRLLETGRLQPDDEHSARDTADENRVLDRVAARDWEGILAALPPQEGGQRRAIARRWPLGIVDTLRARAPVGDR